MFRDPPKAGIKPLTVLFAEILHFIRLSILLLSQILRLRLFLCFHCVRAEKIVKSPIPRTGKQLLQGPSLSSEEKGLCEAAMSTWWLVCGWKEKMAVPRISLLYLQVSLAIVQTGWKVCRRVCMRNTRLAGKRLCFFRFRDQKRSRVTKMMDQKEEQDNDRKQ